MADPTIEQPHAPDWLRHLINGAPTIGFLVALLITRDFPTATWTLMALSFAALALVLILERRIAPVPAFSGVMALVFGGLALALHRNDLLQMKMTIVDTVLGAVLFGGLLMKRNPLKALLGETMNLPDEAWRGLMLRYGAFWWASAVANEIVRRTQTTVVWAEFRVVALVAAILFGAVQVFFLRKYWTEGAPQEAPEPPESGF
jgi:intracellular septation protein